MFLGQIATGLLTLLFVAWLKERALYVIFPWAYVQNFVLAWMYTSGWAGEDLCRDLLLSKEFLLLWLFLLFLPVLFRHSGGRWPLPIRILGFFTAWCVLRYAAAVVFQGESLFGNLWNLRIACFPFETLTVGLGVTWARPEFAKALIRNMVYLVVVLALVGIVLDVAPGPWFWRDHVNIASYSVYVKGNSLPVEIAPADIQAEVEGIGGNGRARDAFSFLSPFRAFGTVGDAVGFGHLVAFPTLLLAFCLRRDWKRKLMLVLTAAALFLSFTRSAWAFVLLGFVYVLLRTKHYRLLFGLGIVCLGAIYAWVPRAQLYSATLGSSAWSGSEDPHAQGTLWLYKQGLWQFENLFGQGLTAHIPEGGYGRLLITYGFPAVLGFVWFCIALYRGLRRTPLREKPLFLVAQAVPLVLLLTLNFSFYPFSFIPYLLTWFVVGACLAASSAVKNGAADGTSRLVLNPADARG